MKLSDFLKFQIKFNINHC